MVTRTRILFVTHCSPFPARRGGQVYTGNILRELAAADGVEVTAVCYTADDVDPVAHPPTEVAGVTWVGVPYRRAAPVRRGFAVLHHTAAYREALESLLRGQRWDLVIVDYIAMASAVRTVWAVCGGARPPIVHLTHNVESVLRRDIAADHGRSSPRYLLARWDAWRIARLERLVVTESDVTTAETDEDARTLRRLYPQAKVVTLAPGYDGARVDDKDFDATSDRDVLVLGGRQSAMKQQVLDALLHAAAPTCARESVRIVIAGPMPQRYREKVTRAYPSVRVLGRVDDVTALLATFRLGVVADHVGGGFKHRILTLVFHRVPLIARAEAMAGLPLTPGVDYIPVDDYADIAAVARAWLDEPPAALASLADNAVEKCADAFNWSEHVGAFLTFARSLDRARGPAGGVPQRHR